MRHIRNMLARSNSIRFGFATLAAAVMLLGTPSVSFADTGSIHIVITKAGFIVGVGGGSGTLRFKGKRYGLSIGGVSMGTIGLAKAELIGPAYNMHRPDDIAGTYTAVSGSVAVAGGAKGVQLQNARGVVMVLQGRQVGLEASLSLSGMTVSVR